MNDAHPDLLYIQITACATVGMVLATMFMIYWQIRATRGVAKVQLTMDLMDRYDSAQTRTYRRALAEMSGDSGR